MHKITSYILTTYILTTTILSLTLMQNLTLWYTDWTVFHPG